MKQAVIGIVCAAVAMNSLAFGEPVKKESYDSDLFRKDKKVFFTNLEFLYWTVNEGALDYALQMKKPAWGNPTEGIGHYKIADFEWRPGFRLNFGYFNAPHYWDTFLQFTHFKGEGHDHAHASRIGENIFLDGTWPQPVFSTTSPVPLSKAKSSIEMKLDLAEWLVTRRFHPNPHFRMRLLGGPTVGWLRQHWKVHYRDIQGSTSHMRAQWRFTGAGLRAGLMLDWFLGRGGIFFTGLFSAACYAGSYHNSNKEHSSDNGNGAFDTSLPLRNIHYHDTRLVAQFQALAGPSWQMAFEKIRTELFAGYELNFWSNLHEVYRTSQGAPAAAKQTFINSSIMALQGLTVRWNLDF